MAYTKKAKGCIFETSKASLSNCSSGMGSNSPQNKKVGIILKKRRRKCHHKFRSDCNVEHNRMGRVVFEK